MINAAAPGDVRYIQYNRHYIEYLTRSQEPAAGPRAGGCAWECARVLVRVLVEIGGVLVYECQGPS